MKRRQILDGFLHLMAICITLTITPVQNLINNFNNNNRSNNNDNNNNNNNNKQKLMTFKLSYYPLLNNSLFLREIVSL